MFFCIPAYGHHNPTIAVVRELTQRGNRVRYFSFEEFRAKIEGAGAEFIPCDKYLPEADAQVESGAKTMSSTEMTIADLKTTANMDAFLKE
jgi:UDP:flavonoid glycosyltransferase YjiC (YdhE family)